MIGTTIGNYVIRSKLGEGGMGAVYLAEHARLGRRVAIKVLLPHLGRDPQMIARFFNEAKAATDIKNEHIVDVLDFGELPDGTSYIVMEWLEGWSLVDVLREGRLPLARAVHIARGIGKALAAAHARGIVHRDLKPDNVFLVSRDGDRDFVKVLDFGIAKLTLGNAGDVRTQTGAMMGTPLYMSPEQINGTNVDQRTDIYAMGIIIYQMLIGTLPFNTTTLTELLLAHATQVPPPLRAQDPSIPVAVEGAVLQALEKDPSRRFGSVEALLGALSDDTPRIERGPAAGPVSALAATVAPQMSIAAAAPAPSKTLPLILVGGGLGLLGLVALMLTVLLRSSVQSTHAAEFPDAMVVAASTAPPMPAPTPTPSESPASATAKTSPTTVDHWKLAKTDCPSGSVPTLVETTHTSTSFVSRAAGFPDTVGTTSSDGKFHVHNPTGACTGTATERLVTETCTNKYQMACHLTYERAD
jgi:eukaryotic-like serine/threonine-protein kinase